MYVMGEHPYDIEKAYDSVELPILLKQQRDTLILGHIEW